MAESLQLLFCAFSLFCVASCVTSRQSNQTDGRDLLSMLNTNPEDRPPEGVQKGSRHPFGDTQASDYMIQLFLKLSQSNGQVMNPEAVKGDHVHGFIGNDGSSDRNFTFNVSIPRRETPRFAEFLLYKYPSNHVSYSRSNVSVTIHDIYSGRKIASKFVPIKAVGWISFALPRRIIFRWDRKPQTNAGLSVRISGPNRVSNAIRFATRQENVSLQSLIVVHCSVTSSFFDELQKGTIKRVPRQRRSVQSSHEGKCGLHELNVHVKDLGWEKWVIAPKQYSASYCAGTCLDRYDSTQSNHALIQLIIHQREPEYANAPCCAPTQLASISMLYFGGPGESTYVLKQMNDFVVRACACN